MWSAHPWRSAPTATKPNPAREAPHWVSPCGAVKSRTFFPKGGGTKPPLGNKPQGEVAKDMMSLNDRMPESASHRSTEQLSRAHVRTKRKITRRRAGRKGAPSSMSSVHTSARTPLLRQRARSSDAKAAEAPRPPGMRPRGSGAAMAGLNALARHAQSSPRHGGAPKAHSRAL